MKTAVQPKFVNRAATLAPAAAARLLPRPAALVTQPVTARAPSPVSSPAPGAPAKPVAATPPSSAPERDSRTTSPLTGTEKKIPPRAQAAPRPQGELKAAAPEAKPGPPSRAAATRPRVAIAPAIRSIRQRALRARHHPEAKIPVESATEAGKHPETEQIRGAAKQTVENLNEARATQIQRELFKTRLKEAIDKATPKPTTESQAEKVMKTGAADASQTMRQELAAQRESSVKPLKAAAKTEASPSKQPRLTGTPLQLEQVGPTPSPVSATPVVPAPLPPEQLDYSSDRAPTEQMMAENQVTPEQLQKGNEPAFGTTLQARSAAEKHEADAAARYRQSEAKVQTQARMQADHTLTQGLAGMHDTRTGKIGLVIGAQLATQGRNLAERQRITNKISEIKNRARADVNTILNEMASGAAEIFETGLGNAEKVYKATFEEEKGGTWTWLTTWGSDWEELIENSLATARLAYLNQVNLAIDQVAFFVGAKLVQAKNRVTTGLKEVQDFVNGLNKSVKHFGDDALKLVEKDFAALDAEIDQRRDGLIDKLAGQYKASYERMSAMEEKLREENKSLWQRVYDATVGLIKKILAFKDMLLNIIMGAISLVLDIISDPIGFLGNLVSAVKEGLEKFIANITVHLEKGLMDWLFGAIAASGLKLPEHFDLQGVVSLVLQLLGFTYARFRARAVALVGEPVVAALEQAAEVFKTVIAEGALGLWRFIKDQVTDLKSLVLDSILSFIKDRVIIAGITWIIGLLNPASAFFKACKAIYDIVVFFINRGSQIIALVKAIIDSIKAIAKGAIATAVLLVEGALVKAIPVAIGFLASLLGLGDPSKPVRETIEKARSPIDKAIDWVIHLAVKAVKAAGKLIGGLLGGKKDKAKEEKIPGDHRNLYTLAREALLNRLGPEASVAEGREAASQVLKELGPHGLHSLDLHWSETSNSYVFDAAASPGKEIIWLTPSNKQVIMYSKITFKGAAKKDMEEKFYAESSQTLEITGGRRVARPTPPTTPRLSAADPRGQRKQSLLVVEPSPGSSELETVSWNAGGPVEGSNVSHAETQFVDWVTSPQRGPLWRTRIKGVAIHISHSPCDHCAPDLKYLADMLPNAENLEIRWDELYVDPNGQRSTSAAGLRKLSKWTLIGPKPAPAAKPSVQKRVKSKP